MQLVKLNSVSNLQTLTLKIFIVIVIIFTLKKVVNTKKVSKTL